MTKPKAAFVCVHNKSLMLHTTMNYVALWNVVQKIYTLLLMPIVGITQGGGYRQSLPILTDIKRKIRNKKHLV